MECRNIFENIPEGVEQEFFDSLAGDGPVTIERIVSQGQATPKGDWLLQDHHEWVIVLKGRAGLRFKDQKVVLEMVPGDYLLIPGGTHHRVEWTAENEPTVWLAVHYHS